MGQSCSRCSRSCQLALLIGSVRCDRVWSVRCVGVVLCRESLPSFFSLGLSDLSHWLGMETRRCSGVGSGGCPGAGRPGCACVLGVLGQQPPLCPIMLGSVVMGAACQAGVSCSLISVAGPVAAHLPASLWERGGGTVPGGGGQGGGMLWLLLHLFVQVDPGDSWGHWASRCR